MYLFWLLHKLLLFWTLWRAKITYALLLLIFSNRSMRKIRPFSHLWICFRYHWDIFKWAFSNFLQEVNHAFASLRLIHNYNYIGLMFLFLALNYIKIYTNENSSAYKSICESFNYKMNWFWTSCGLV